MRKGRQALERERGCGGVKGEEQAEFLPATAVHPFHDADQKVSLSRTRTALGMFNALVNLAPSEQSWLAITMATWNRPRRGIGPPAPFCTEQNP